MTALTCLVGRAGCVLCCLALLFSLLSPWLQAADSVAHFRHLLFLAAATLAVLSWHRRMFLVTGVVIVSGLASSPELWPPRRQTDHHADLRLMQHNLNSLNADLDLIEAQIRRESPDVITFQELSTVNHALTARLAETYPAQILCSFNAVMTVSIFSKRAFDAKPVCRRRSGMVTAGITIDGVVLTIASVHLHWPWPHGQTAQVDELGTYLSALPEPVIVAGDFNASPWSRTVRKMGDAARARVISGLRQTIHVSRFQVPLPIDHVLLPSGAGIIDIRVGAKAGSDHNAVIADIVLPRR